MHWSRFYAGPNGNHADFDQVMEAAVERLHGEQPTIDNMRIAIKEIFSNYREHGYHMDKEKRLYFHLSIDHNMVVATICACVKAWTRNGWVEITEEQASYELVRLAHDGAERGRGTYMVALTTDSFRYEANGNVCVLTWRRKKRGWDK